ncbi:MAG TPA: hypothetical protein VIH99_03005, partial [Bdellovibrionota bacterium]
KQQAIEEDAITPEAAGDVQDEEIVLLKKKPKTVTQRKVIVREQTETAASMDAELPAQTVAAPPAATKPSMGNQLDEGVKAKMVDVQSQFESALLKTLDKIKITVEDGSAPQGSSTPTQSVVVQDSLVNANAAPAKADYMSVDSAPSVKVDDQEDLDGEEVSASVAADKAKSERKVRVAPVFGRTMINSDYYNVDSKYTAGFELEMDVENNFALVLGYSYSQYDIGLAGNSPFYGYYNGFGGNTQTLGYNQNLFSGLMRMYLMPRESKFRIFGGVGAGYNLGYLNYRQSQYGANPYNPYGYGGYGNSSTDYEVKSWLGLLESGASFNISENVSLGALFRYALVFSSSENQPLNNYGFVNNGYNYGATPDQSIVGGSLAKENFYSILGTVKVAF